METELWPNTIAACQQQGIKILLANARLSEKSALGYRRIASLSRQMLSAVDAIAPSLSRMSSDWCSRCRAQLDSSNRKPEVLSGDGPHLSDRNHEAEPFLSVRQSGRQVVVFASTREGEEAIILRALSGLMTLRMPAVPAYSASSGTV